MLKHNVVLRPVFGAILHFTTLVQQVGIKLCHVLSVLANGTAKTCVCVVCACV